MFSDMKARALPIGCILLVTTIATAAAQSATDDYSAFAFVPNGGQYRADVAFVSRMRTDQIFVLTDGRIVHALPIERTAAESISAWVVVETLPGATVAPRGARVADQRVTWLRTAASPSISDTHSFTALKWRDAWPGVDMVLQIVEDRTERVFHVAPGADWNRIALAFDGVHFKLDASGGLTAHAGTGELMLSAPVAFQDTARGRVPVDVRYVVDAQGTRVSFDVGAYDKRLPLTIDPVLQSTYFGFGGASEVTAIAIDPATGDLIAAGNSLGLGVPGLAGGFQTVHAADMGFVARIDAKLQRVIQSTLIGGVLPEQIKAVAVHPQTGEIYVAGRTNSPDFPGGGGGAVQILGGSRDDGFVSRFSADLRTLLQTTFTNQSLKYVHVHDLAISATSGDVYVAGEGLGAAYLLRFNRQLTSQLSRVILEGNATARAFSVSLNQTSGDVYISGATTATIFPQTAGGVETTYERKQGDGETGFVARFNADLSQHLQSTYLSDFEPQSHAVAARMTPLVAVNPTSGDVYVTGMSSRSDLPTTGGAQPAYGGGQVDVVLTRLSADLRQRRSATYFGSSDYEVVIDLTFTPDGAQVYLTGFTFGNNLPGTAGGAMPVDQGEASAYIARLSASLSTLHQATYFTVPGGNATGRSVLIHPMSGEVYFGGQCTNGVVETTGGLQPLYGGEFTVFGTGCLARFDALLSGGDDADPDTFSFADQFAVAPGAVVTSAPVRIEGITGSVAASVSNGSFSIDGGPFEINARQVRRGQNIRVRHTAAAAAGTATDTVLNVGSRTDTFTSVSATGMDSAANPFSFAARNPVAMDIDIESDPITVAGIDAPAAISIANGEYSIDGENYTSAAGTINGGQTVIVRQITAAAPATVTDSILTIGGVSASFKSTTDPVDSSVHPFSIPDVRNITPDFLATSEPVVIMGINVPAPVSVTGGEWSTDGLTFQSAPGFVNNLTPIVVRRRSGPAGTTVKVTLTVGDQSDDWVLGQPQLGDTTPDPFSFTPVTDATPGTNVFSNTITVTGVDVPVWIEAGGGFFLDPVSGLYLTSGFIANGATTKIRVLTFPVEGAASPVRVRIGTAESTFEVRNTGSDSVPDPFDFTDQTGVAAGAQVVSDVLTVSGLTRDTRAAVTGTGCELSVNSAAFDTAAVMVVNGDRVRIRAAASTTAGATVSCSIDIGGVTDVFRVTTATSSGGGGTGGGGGGGSSGGGGASGGSSGGGGGGGALDFLVLLGLALLKLIGARESALAASSTAPRAGRRRRIGIFRLRAGGARRELNDSMRYRDAIFVRIAHDARGLGRLDQLIAGRFPSRVLYSIAKLLYWKEF